MTPGRFITFEGIDGSGKSTQADLLVASLHDTGQSVLRTREPGGTPLGEAIREVLLAPGREITPLGEVYLFAAARAQLVREVIAPALETGSWVVCDRFLDSSLAYQGGGRGLGIEQVAAINAEAVGKTVPDLTVLLDISPERAAARREGDDDRIEAEGMTLQERVATAYREVAAGSPDRVSPLDADRAAEVIHADVVGLVARWR